MANFRMSIKLHRGTKRESGTRYAVAEYESLADAERVLEKEIKLKGIVLEIQAARKGKEDEKRKEEQEQERKDNKYEKEEKCEQEEKEEKYERESRKGMAVFKNKVYLGNLDEDFTEADLKKIVEGKLEPTRMFVSKSLTEKNKRYAFLEFSSQTERNVALGKLEEMKQDGAVSDDIIVSPAYPSNLPKKNYKRYSE